VGYLKDAVRGVTWVGAYRASSRLIAFAKTAILARILVPAQFGIFGIAGLALTLLETLTQTGINIFLVQEEDDVDSYIDTAWVVSITRGILIALTIIILTPFIASFFRVPEARNILFLTSLVPFLRGFINPSIVKFQKDLEFDKEFRFKLPIYVTESVVAIVLALLTHDASSFIWGMIAGVIIEILLSFIVVRPVPKFSFEAIKIKRVVSQGKWVTAFGAFDYLFQNLDDFTVGRFLGKSSLGVYQVAYKISSLPITEVADVFSRVTFPVFRKISNDKERLKKAFIKTTLGISALVIPFGAVIFLFSEQIVLILLGNNWVAAIPVLKVLSLYGIIRGIFYPMMAVFLALQKQQYITVVTLVGILGLGLSIIPLVNRFGIVGAGISTLVGSLATAPVIIYYLLKIFKEMK
jgi:O-antigen/teichoic acid export membrane protein